MRFRKADDEISDFAQKHNLNRADVEAYADYMGRENLNGAARAFHEIRRKVRLDNQGASLGQFTKIFSPIEKELYDKFGNIDDLRQQYVQRTLDERNAMEAARKRAEEAAEAERRRLQEFQDMSDEQLDSEYIKAVDENDEGRMRDLVNEAARRKGYGDIQSDYQGVGAWAAPSNPGYESDEERREALQADGTDVNVTDIAEGYSSQPDDYFTNLRAYGNDTPHGKESAKAINDALEEIRKGNNPKIKVYRAVPKSVKEGRMRNGDWVTPSRKYAEMHGDNRLEGDYRIIEQEVPANELWWDGNDLNEWGFDDGKGYAYRNTKNNRKLNDLITRDDGGNIIPLSQRFNARKPDVRYNKDRKRPLSAEEAAIRDAVVGRLRESGLEVITDVEEGQRVLDEANGRGERVRTQPALNGLKKASDFILSALSEKTKQRRARIEIPERANRLAEEAIGHPIKSHAININELTHIKKRHGENGTANDANSIPLRDKDIALMPYIMAAPTRVVKGNMAANGTESVRYEKDLENGVVVVVEREGRFDVEDMENITMWANKKPATNVTVATKTSHSTSETIVISEADAAKIRKDAETAIENDGKIREHRVYHGSAADFEQAYGWGSYVTEVKGIGKSYATSNEEKRAKLSISEKKEYIKRRKRDIKEMGDYERYAKKIMRNRRNSEKEYKAAKKAGNEQDMRFYEDLMAISDSQLKRENHKALIDSFYDDINKAQSEIDELEAKFKGNHHLYTVEIPDDAGENYLNWADEISGELKDDILNRLSKIEDEAFDYDYFVERLEDYEDNYNLTGEGLYKLLSRYGFDSNAQKASEALHEIGFTGIKYPADYQRGGREDGAQNYVIFNENDLKITGHVRFFRTADGEAYGFTVGGKIYIDPRVATADTPIHEYAHLWASALRQGNQEEWQNVVGLMKGTPVWDEVKRKYPELTTDDEIADEVLATYSGRRGAERLKEEARKATSGKPVTEAARAVTAIGRVREALRKFWQNVADFLHIHYTSAEEVADRVMRDLLEGVNPAELTSNNEKSDKVDDYTTNEEEANDLFRVVDDVSEIERLNNEPTIKVYRAMSLVDGKLYPPMSKKIGTGSSRISQAPSEFGQWEVSDERPELVEKDGKNKSHIYIVKDNGKGLWVAYNPYFHTSRNPLNDQFAEAYQRPNLVTVEVEVPESELTSGYQAEGAKDPVGETKWNAGPVNRQLSGDKKRKVILSRWMRPVRIVPESEVAQRIAELIEGENVAIPDNTVTPSLLEELKKLGVKIVDGINKGQKKASTMSRNGNGTLTDDDLTNANDPASKLLGKSTRTARQRREFAERERGRMVKRVQELAKTLHLDNVDIVTDASTLHGKRAKAKGFFSRSTGKITIVIPNHRDLQDVEQTLLHEAVAHYGLRQLFGEHFDTFIDNVYNNVSPELKQRIDAMSQEHGWCKLVGQDKTIFLANAS